MNDNVKLVLSLSLSGSILAALIFALKPLIRHRLSKSIQYLIWIVVLFRFIIPFSFEGSIMNELFYKNDKNTLQIHSQTTSKTNIDNDEKIAYSPMLTDFQGNVTNDISYREDGSIAKLKKVFGKYAMPIWFLGILVVLFVNLAEYARFLKYMKAANKPATDEQSTILSMMLDGRYKLKLYRNSVVATPMLIGLMRPCIIIPDTNFTEKQLKYILRHEITHLMRYDIAAKWLTMIAVSIHWFNPLMYLIRREINNTCELACDEAVIKNLNAEEKQDYGNTLIDLAAGGKYPSGVLQVTMCEEKRSLKERLMAIMSHSKKSKPILILSLVMLISFIAGGLYLGACIGMGSNTPPNIYIRAENVETKGAVIGTYSWNSTCVDSIGPLEIKYRYDNIINTGSGQQLSISTQKIKMDKKFNFELSGIIVYKDGNKVEFQSPDPCIMDGVLYFQVPIDAGEYIYDVTLRYKNKGQVGYSFVVRVDMMIYNLTRISKYKTQFIGDANKVSGLAQNLPVPDKSLSQEHISLVTDKKPYKLTVFYGLGYGKSFLKQWPIIREGEIGYLNLQKNALVLFCMIDNVDEITFAFRKSPFGEEFDEKQYDLKFTFNRTDLQDKYGDLAALGKDIELLRYTLEGKNTGSKAAQEKEEPKMGGFTTEEINAASKVVEEYFRAVKVKDDKAILKTLTESYNIPNVVLYGEETRTLISVRYKADNPMRDSYVEYGRGRLNGVKRENVLVLLVKFNVKYPEGISGSYNEGDYHDWNMILVRKDKNSPWLIDGQGV